MKTVLKLLIAVALLNAVVRGADSAWNYYQLKDAAQRALLFGAQASSKQIHGQIMERAVELRVPLMPEALTVSWRAGRRIAELGLEEVVAGHCQKPGVDLTRLSGTDPVHRRLHVVVDAPPRHAAEDPERMPVSIEQHLVGLQQVGPEQERPAVRELDVGDLKLRVLPGNRRPVLAPVELEGLPGLNTSGTKVPRPAVCCSRWRSAFHFRAKADRTSVV